MPVADPANQVQGAMSVYDCPNLTAVDKHITQVNKAMRKIAASGKYPELPARYASDIDLLLERRMWLQVLREEVPT